MSKLASFFSLTVLVFFIGNVCAQNISTTFNDRWYFAFDSDTTNWKQVLIPHTWNVQDVYGDEAYFRGVGWYRKEFVLDTIPSGQSIWLKFEAVNQIAEVYINKQSAGKHIGGYNAFYIEITPYLRVGRNDILVKADNRHNDLVIPLKGDFNFYGGIYRDVWLVRENEVFFSHELGAEGVFINSHVTALKAETQLSGTIVNRSAIAKKVILNAEVIDDTGKIVVSNRATIMLNEGDNDFSMDLSSIKEPRLWSPSNPYLYSVKLSVNAQEGSLLDEFVHPYGYRFFEFTADQGFFLNGEPLKLHGVNRHQDFKNMGNALPNELHRSDIEMVKRMGANFLRTAHYPQDRAVLQACDKLGLVVSMEIPLDHEITDHPVFYQNTRISMKEMIRQHFNHPSVVIWAYMNEMFLGKNPENHSSFMENVVSFAKELESLTREEDPHRYTMIPNHGALDLYYNSGLLDIPMIVGWNVYFGWYYDDFSSLTTFLNHHRKKMPNKPVMITEYGAGADPRLYAYPYLDSLNGEWNTSAFDFSINYQNAFHLSYINQFEKLDFLSGTAVWNMFDFGSFFRQDTDPRINSKGLTTQDRTPKDAFFIYKSWLNDAPGLNFLTQSHTPKVLTSNKDRVTVSTNTKEVELFVNGVSYGMRSVVNGLTSWEVPIRNGRNNLKAVGYTPEDTIHAFIEKNYGILTAPYSDLNLSFGTCLSFITASPDEYWIPASAMEESFVVEGGINFKRNETDRGCDQNGSLQNITNTDNDPLYQTQVIGMESLQIKLKPGIYRVKLLFAKLLEEASAFDVFINGKFFAQVNQSASHEALTLAGEVFIKDQLEIDFSQIRGKAYLNGLQLTKTD